MLTKLQVIGISSVIELFSKMIIFKCLVIKWGGFISCPSRRVVTIFVTFTRVHWIR